MNTQTMNLHNITKIEVAEVETLTRSDGATFFTRDVAFTHPDGAKLTITAFSQDAKTLAIEHKAE